MAHRPKIDNSVTGVRSNQNLSCNWTGSADFGRLIPFHWEELLPTDKVIRCKPRIEMQMLEFAAPTFGKIDLYVHYFVVPLRQLQDNFYDIWSQTGVYKSSKFPWVSPKKLQEIYANSTANPATQRAMFKHWTSLGLNPFFAMPSNRVVADDTTPLSLFPFRAYNKIWWDFYRDPELIRDSSMAQYLQTSDVNNNPDLSDGYRFMYPHVRSIKNNWISDLFSDFGPTPNDYDYESLFNNFPPVLQNLTDGNATKVITEENLPIDGEGFPHSQTAQVLRIVESLTRLSERLSLSGKREIEALFARYGVKPKWSEMNLCRYVGGSKSTVLVSELRSTADTVSGDGSIGSPLGRKAGTGYCALNDLNIEVDVDEPSILMGILSVMPHIHFVQGISKKWQRKELPDMFQKSLEHVGQVAVAKREIGKSYDIDGGGPAYDDAEDSVSFAFSDPYYEYKMGLDILAGDFMKYHSAETDNDTTLYMQSMEQYIDFPATRDFTADNLKVDGDAFNKIFYYLGGSVDEDVDDHFHLCIDKDVLINRPMEGYAIPTLETTQNPHESKTQLSADKML